MDKVVDIADIQVSNDPTVDLVTYSLGSCIGVSIWDPELHVAGMLHFMLPQSSIAQEKARTHPAMFADTGIPQLFRSAYELGAVKKRLIVKVAGGSSLLNDNGMFNIGKRNYIILRKIFWKNGILISSENVGGSVSRTMRLQIGSGRVTIRIRGKEMEL
jgi:chemotaxis protein CheD